MNSPNPQDIVDTYEIVRRLGLSRIQQVHTWMQRNKDFPEPFLVLRADSTKPLRLWNWQDIRYWHRLYIEQGRHLPGSRK